MIQLKELKTSKELKEFVKFPFKLYKNNPYWVPPIINDELESFDKTKNPVFKHADARFYIAIRNQEIVGRVAAIINHTEVNQQGLKKMRFGWCDFIDNYEVSRLLFDKITEIGIGNELEFMEGPVGFSNLDKVGVLTNGFDHIGTMITWYNSSYYKDHYREYGFEVEKEYAEYKFPFSNAKPEFFVKASNLIKRRYQVKPVNFTKSKDIFPYVDEMFDLFNTTYASLESFVPISDIQKKYFKEKYISFINPEYIKFVLDKDGKMICFGITMPSFSEALQKANGKLFPFGFYHLLKAKKHSKDIIFYLIGVAPEYQNKGITAVIFEEYYKTFKAKNIEYCYRTPELTTNTAIAAIWKNFDPKVYKTRCTFRKKL